MESARTIASPISLSQVPISAVWSSVPGEGGGGGGGGQTKVEAALRCLARQEVYIFGHAGAHVSVLALACGEGDE